MEEFLGIDSLPQPAMIIVTNEKDGLKKYRYAGKPEEISTDKMVKFIDNWT
jgi:hypothetical protein